MSGMLPAPNVFVSVGGAITVIGGDIPGEPGPPFVDPGVAVLTMPVPTTVPVTLTVKVQEFGEVPIAPPVRDRVVAPAAGLNVPPQVLEAPVGLPTCKPPGRVSATVTPVRATEFGLVTVIVTVVQ